jgi:predicted ATP-grasp superfamily ATP-dependent carboligase
MKNVVIFAGSALGSVLAIAQNVKEESKINSYVVCINSKYASVFNASKYVTESINISGGTDIELFNKFNGWFSQKDFSTKPILFFTTDTSCLFADKYREWFENHFHLTIPSSPILNTYNFKGEAEKDAEKNGLTVPKTQLINLVEHVNKIANSFTFPVIIKPTSSQTKKSIGFKVEIIKNAERFKSIVLPIIRKDKALLCQEYIPGNDKKVHYYIFYRDARGNVFDTMGIKTLQSPPNGGIMAKGISKYNAEIAQMSRNFLAKIDYEGIGGIEYKEYNGQYYFIEMSTRPEGFFLISEKAGVPITKIVSKTLSENVEYKVYQQKDRIKYIDLLSTLAARRSSKKYFSLFVDYFDAVFNPKTYINTFKLNDMMPFFTHIKILLKWT